ncbi:MAG TPA: hypothetical protein VGO04_09855 [Ensifer sp.]|jgi:hypothetical protein|uniref:hypothetical protein n=1 Tax=Ensifer sp. TaxID=1872086 RepID=UPI002E1361C2|nr:hypothetical protein [Ensifer sp.]
MKAALIVMTILGCDHDVSQCQFISTVNGTWPSIAQCDTASHAQLPKFSNANFPVVVAVCETSGPGLAELTPPPAGAQQAQTPEQAAAPEPEPNLPKRTMAFLSGAIPDREKLKTIVTAPVHYIEDGYSWVARRFTD